MIEEYCGSSKLDRAALLERWRSEFGRNGELQVHEAVGCRACRDGYKGRLGIYELLTGTDDLKHLVRTRAPVPELVTVAQQNGMRLLRQDAIEKALAGSLDLLSGRAASS